MLEKSPLPFTNQDHNLRLLCVAAHPDDEAMAMGGTLAHYASQGIQTFVLTATRGQRGRYRDNSNHPGPEQLGKIREAELRAAAHRLGVHDIRVLNYRDGDLDQADQLQVTDLIATYIREVRPQVVMTFGPEGLYGHPDHIAISQLTTAAILRAASVESSDQQSSFQVSKLYYLAWSVEACDNFENAYKPVSMTVDGSIRRTTPWPDWMITTSIDTTARWRQVRDAVFCHRSQVDSFNNLSTSSDRVHQAVWGSQEFYRVFSLVNSGRDLETDLFDGLRQQEHSSTRLLGTSRRAQLAA